MKALVTGSSGFIGTHLTQKLVTEGHTVTALQRKAGDPTTGAKIHVGDIEDYNFVSAAMRESKPDVVFHLAAQSSPKLSWSQPKLTFRTNMDGTLNLLDAIRKYSNHSRFVIVSSSAVYSEPARGLALSEDDIPNPASPYGLSKLSAEEMCRIYADQYNLDYVVARPFFIIGATKDGDVCSDWAKQIVRIEHGIQKCLEVGNLDIVRDFLHVSDAVTALIEVAQRGLTRQVYNICSGRGISLRTVADTFRHLARRRIPVVQTTERVSTNDDLIKIGSNRRLITLGWSEALSYEAALSEIINYWRGQQSK